MVFYSKEALADLNNLLIGLVYWSKHYISLEHAQRYYDDIRQVCDNLPNQTYHFDAKYKLHKKYGKKVYSYRRSSATTWYIIYNIDENNDVYIEKILNNYLTNSEMG
ncbi:MAG: type II toxin-antitoxin system RelE/ParE family toxin [Tannerellaceae bacterium]|jgi:plasmid stabilization system protein ParE|nr:type II toxin-antitoxin system RelE/ParE family toxin [Tannerellaceae bacterium]